MAAILRADGYFFRKILAIVAVAVVFTSIPAVVDTASAQEVIRRQNFFERLFGGSARRQQPPVVQPQPGAPVQRAPQRQRQTTQPRRSQQSASPAPAPKPVIEKLENAKVVLVVGDFLAGGVAGGLVAAYENSPGARIEDRSNGSSGFVRDDYYNWNTSISPIIEEVKPAAIVVMLGSNDRQQLSLNGQSLRPQTEPWIGEYTKRVTDFAASLNKANIPFLWVGLPPFKSPAMTSDMLAFNDIHKKAAEAAGGTFIDIWDGFVDENGAFISTGPDMNGQPVRLRSNDGINLTREARRKIAFYLEKPLNQILGAAASPSATTETAALPGNAAEPTRAAAPRDLSRTGPISLMGPGLNGNSGLLGDQQWTPPETERNLFKPQPGRADFILQGETQKTKEAASDEAAPQ